MAGPSSSAKVAIGILAWIGVALFAVVVAANWDTYWGMLLVLVAVVIAWAIGELVMQESSDGDGGAA